jgi:hypothetical protein
LKNSNMVAVCAALLLFTITAVGQQNPGSTAAAKETSPTISSELPTAGSDADSKLDKVPLAPGTTNPRPQGDTDPE